MTTHEKTLQRVAAMPFASVYPHYVTKVEKKGRTREELHAVITWLTGYDDAEIQHHLDAETPFEETLMQQVRWMDKLVDELAKGKALEKILRG
ncbi:DUF2200 family protein [Kocuria palustris]|uniref:DUF2200 family protein n=1 Tax=Kocuria palustris TaxID=71999 RepID=UPI002042E40B|nr:DUF2200 family protein [Kocuria palustris]MCM3330508.1 DUF2200 domain-containing protein [Kocuria palustris]